MRHVGTFGIRAQPFPPVAAVPAASRHAYRTGTLSAEQEKIDWRDHRPPTPGRTLRYGQGTLTGKRALVVVTAGSPQPALGPRGINGQLDLVLFPLLRGTLWYSETSTAAATTPPSSYAPGWPPGPAAWPCPVRAENQTPRSCLCAAVTSGVRRYLPALRSSVAGGRMRRHVLLAP